MLFKLALRNVFRNRRRTLITISAVMIGVCSYIILDEMLAAFNNHSINNLIKVETAHIKLYAKDYWENRYKDTIENYITDETRVVEKLSSLDGIRAVTGRINFRATSFSHYIEIPVTGIGIDRDGGDEKVFHLKEFMTKGKYLEPGENAILGVETARLLKLDVGDMLTLEFRDINGIFDALQVVITGIFDTGHPGIDKGVIYFPLDLVKNRMDMPDSVTEICILLDRERDINRIKKSMQAAELDGKKIGDHYEVMTWREQAADFIAFDKAKSSGSSFILMILIIIIIVGILNTMLMSVYERVREIGTLMSMGMNRKKIRMLFLYEGSLIGLLGALAGLMLGLLFMAYFSVHGLDFSSITQGKSMGYIVKDVVYGSIHVFTYIKAMILGVVVALFSSYFPARNASNLHPAEALRRF